MAVRTTGSRDRGPSSVIATTRRMCWIRTATAWRSALNRGCTTVPIPSPARAQRQPTEGDEVRTAPPAQQQAGGDMAEIRPFRVEISDAAIDDLRERLARTRWPEKEPVGDWSMGIPLAYVQELAEYWQKSYDMQRVAERLNRYQQFITAIDGVDIHFLWVRSPVERATPYIMTHGWPGSVMEF